jgi:Protein of unknown function (DUF3667)
MPDETLLDAAAGAATETVAASALMGEPLSSEGENPAPGTICSNCHTALKGRHCHHCGQVADTYHRPVWSLFSEILEGYLGLNGKIWRTIPDILFRPGKVTVQYLKGVRQPYMSPFRLFLLSSLLFFLVFVMFLPGNDFTLKGSGQGMDIKDRADIETALEQANADLLTSAKTEADKVRIKKRIAFIESELNRQKQSPLSTPSSYGIGQRLVCELRAELLPKDPLNAACLAIKEEEKVRLQNKAKALGENQKPEDVVNKGPGKDSEIYVEAPVLNGFSIETRRLLVTNIETAVNNPEQYRAALSRWAPRLAFILAPIYGLLLALCFFWRRDVYLYDHMVVALHFHAFLFLSLTLLVPAGLWVGFGVVAGAFVLWSNYYLYQLLRRVYRIGWIGALVRLMILENLYFMVLAMAFLGLLVLGIVFV